MKKRDDFDDDDEGDFGHEKNHDYKFKLILVGESRVGKTSVINQLCKQEFNEDQECSTTVQFFEKDYKLEDNKLAKVHIWDTLGQEKFS